METNTVVYDALYQNIPKYVGLRYKTLSGKRCNTFHDLLTLVAMTSANEP